MGKSVKKSPIVTEKGGKSGRGKWRKTWANRHVRRKLKRDEDAELQNTDYKKYVEQWFINDYIIIMTEKEAIADYEDFSNPNSPHYSSWLFERYPTLESYLKWWRKHYKNK